MGKRGKQDDDSFIPDPGYRWSDSEGGFVPDEKNNDGWDGLAETPEDLLRKGGNILACQWFDYHLAREYHEPIDTERMSWEELRKVWHEKAFPLIEQGDKTLTMLYEYWKDQYHEAGKPPPWGDYDPFDHRGYSDIKRLAQFLSENADRTSPLPDSNEFGGSKHGLPFATPRKGRTR
jgi:hypothetical protein